MARGPNNRLVDQNVYEQQSCHHVQMARGLNNRLVDQNVYGQQVCTSTINDKQRLSNLLDYLENCFSYNLTKSK